MKASLFPTDASVHFSLNAGHILVQHLTVFHLDFATDKDLVDIPLASDEDQVRIWILSTAPSRVGSITTKSANFPGSRLPSLFFTPNASAPPMV